MDDKDIVDRINQLAAEEQQLEEAHVGEGLSENELKRKRDLEVTLDQLWDTLRQRRAKRHAGQDPDAAVGAPGRHGRGLSAVVGRRGGVGSGRRHPFVHFGLRCSSDSVHFRRERLGAAQWAGMRRLSPGETRPARPRRLPIVTSSQSNESRQTVMLPSSPTTKRP